MMKKYTIFPCVALFGFASIAGLAPAQDITDAESAAKLPRYAVEIILFRYGPGVPAGNERFEPDDVIPDFRDESVNVFGDGIPEFGDLSSPDAENESDGEELAALELPAVSVDLRVLPRDGLELQAVYDKLVDLDAYDPVLWTGWTQDVPGPEVSPEIRLRRLGNAPPEFDGSLKLYLSRFLHLVVDIAMEDGTLRRPADRAPFQQRPRPPTMNISEDRIMKNGDLRYYDHPKFGLLAQVRRIDSQTPSADESRDQGQPAAASR